MLNRREQLSQRRTKAANLHARAGETITGNLARGGDGKFTSAGAASSTAAKPKRTPRAERATPEQQQAKRDAATVAKRTATFAALKLPEDAAGSLIDLAAGKPVPDDGGLLAMGLAEQSSDGSYRLSATGRAFVNAAERGDTGAARDAQSRAGDAMQGKQDRQRVQAERQAARDKRRADAAAKPKGGGGGKGSAKPDAAAQQAKNRQTTLAALGTGGPQGAGQATMLHLADTGTVDDPATAAAVADTTGLLTRGAAGGYGLSSAGRAYIKALNSGDAAGARQAIAAGADALAKQQATSNRQATVTARRAAQQELRKRQQAERDALAATKAVRVYKDANGVYRWLAISSTAYRDRDGEIVSTKALADDVARADRTGDYGTLRWWHTPITLGDCDFNALIGRSLVESGTFRTPQVAEKVAAADLEVSIGFLHPFGAPDADGVFHAIRRFERSLTPRGRASNLFTSFTVKEPDMALDDIKRAALKALGFKDSDIRGLEVQAQQVEKAADADGVAFKAAGDMPTDGDGTDNEAAEETSFVGDMNQAEFEAMLTPLITAACAAAMGGAVAKTEDAAQAQATKSAAIEAQVLALTKQITNQTIELTAAQAALKELQGDQPASGGYRASQDSSTALALDAALKAGEPAPDPVLDLIMGMR